MKLHILGSESKGNGYILEGENETLLLECGIKLLEVKRALNFDVSMLINCISSHFHSDHFGRAVEYLNAGINVYANKETWGLLFDKTKDVPFGFKGTFKEYEMFTLGGFKILPIPMKHDVPCHGFYINHKDCGNILFVTDTYYIPDTFTQINHIMVEVNFDQEILDANIEKGLHKSVRDRVMQSHMSIQTFKDFLRANDLSQVRNIILLHLSSGNSDAARFQKEIEEMTGKNVIIADKGMKVDLNLIPF